MEMIKQAILDLGYTVGALETEVKLTKQATKEIIEVLQFEEEANNVYFTVRNKLYVAEIETWNEIEKDVRIITGAEYFMLYRDFDRLKDVLEDGVITEKEYSRIINAAMGW